MTKIPERITQRWEDLFGLTDSEVSVCHDGEGIVKQLISMWIGSRERERGQILQGHTPIDLLPPAKPYFLQYPQPPQIAPPTGKQSFKT
jgi:hypothetical protein